MFEFRHMQLGMGFEMWSSTKNDIIWRIYLFWTAIELVVESIARKQIRITCLIKNSKYFQRITNHYITQILQTSLDHSLIIRTCQKRINFYLFFDTQIIFCAKTVRQFDGPNHQTLTAIHFKWFPIQSYTHSTEACKPFVELLITGHKCHVSNHFFGVLWAFWGMFEFLQKCKILWILWMTYMKTHKIALKR